MTVQHAWRRQFLFEGRAPSEKEPAGKPPVESWLTCATCGAQVCQQGRGKTATFLYRADAKHEWASDEPACREPVTIRVPLAGWAEQPNGTWTWSKKRAERAGEGP